MEPFGIIFYVAAAAGFCGLCRNWIRGRRLARENRRRSEESIRENGRVEDRKPMKIERFARRRT